MGLRRLVAFIQKSVYRGTLNPDNSDPPMLGNAIFRFILPRMDHKMDRMITKLERVRDRQTPI